MSKIISSLNYKAIKIDNWAADLHFSSHLFQKNKYRNEKFLEKASAKDVFDRTVFLMLLLLLGSFLPFLNYFFFHIGLVAVKERSLDAAIDYKFFGENAELFFLSMGGLLFGTWFGTKTKRLAGSFSCLSAICYGCVLAFIIQGMQAAIKVSLWLPVLTCLVSVFIAAFTARSKAKKGLDSLFDNKMVIGCFIGIITPFLIRISFYKTTENLPDIFLFAQEPLSILATFMFFFIGTVLFYREFRFIESQLENGVYPSYLSWHIAQRITLWILAYIIAALRFTTAKK